MAFQQSSCNVTLNGTVLRATCKRADSVTDQQSSLDLNSCVANDNGRLVHRCGGKFGASCSSIHLMGDNILVCKAKTIAGSEVDAQINLSSFIANIGGQLRVK